MEELQSQHAPGFLEGEHYHVIETIPGIGIILAAAFIGEIGDIHRFSSARKLVTYAGIDATARESDKFTGSRNRMSKRGSLELRRAIWLQPFQLNALNLNSAHSTKPRDRRASTRWLLQELSRGAWFTSFIRFGLAISRMIRTTSGDRRAQSIRLHLQLSKCKFAFCY